MEYNTTREKMIIPEYGRNLQKMIQYTCTIEDRERRNKAAKFLVSLMAQMNPQSKEVGDFKHKLWDHLYIIADFKLDVDSPYPPPLPLSVSIQPERIPYHDKEIRFRHYGKNISIMIEKAVDYPDGPEKDALVAAIANHMKKSYLNWNRESVTDEIIEEHLALLSQSRLKLHEDYKLSSTNDILSRNRKRKFVRPNPSGSNQNLHRGRKKQQ